MLLFAGDTAPLPVAGSRTAAAARPMAVRGTPTSFKVSPHPYQHCCVTKQPLQIINDELCLVALPCCTVFAAQCKSIH